MGGIEHAILHLLYARFVTKVLFDQKHIDFDEPFKKLFNQGLILGPDGVKMSKSRGNVVNPDDWVLKYGADTFRMYLMFMGPYDQGGPFDTKGISGTNRFLARVWALVEEFVESENLKLETKNSSLETALTTITHKTIKKVTDDIGAFGFNTAIAALMEMVNELYRLKADLPMGSARSSWLTALSSLLRMLAPMAPHITEELWEQLDGQGSIHIAEWPEYREDLVKDDIVEIAIQVNGKLRGTMVVPIATPDDELKKLAGEQDSVKKHLTGQVLKVIVVPRKLVNFVVKP
jgi:leucyl-tRNA synthetase